MAAQEHLERKVLAALTTDGVNILFEKVVASGLIYHCDSNTDSPLQWFIGEMMDQQWRQAGERSGPLKRAFSVIVYSCCVMVKCTAESLSWTLTCWPVIIRLTLHNFSFSHECNRYESGRRGRRPLKMGLATWKLFWVIAFIDR